MSLTLYAHPFSSYCQKVLTALYENDTPFTLRPLNSGDDAADREFETLWPIKKMPVLIDDSRTIAEASVIIEHLALYHGGKVQLLAEDPKAALDIRFMDRFFDNYIMTPMQRVVGDYLRTRDKRDPQTVTDAQALLDNAYQWLDARMAGREWAAGGHFSLADCAAAPALFYADWTYAIPESFGNVGAYRRRLLARPSFARAVDEARPYRKYFPPGAPDRD